MPTPITVAILDTVLGYLAPHFLEAADSDLPTARHAASRMLAARHTASRMLAAHNPQTEEELHLTADIVSFGFHTLEVLSAAAAPGLSLNQKLRLRGNAVSLNRQAHKARHALDQFKRIRLAEPAEPPAEAGASDDEPPAHLIDAAREAVQAATKPGAFKSWTMSRKQQRRAAERVAETLHRTAEQTLRQSPAAAPATSAQTSNQPALV